MTVDSGAVVRVGDVGGAGRDVDRGGAPDRGAGRGVGLAVPGLAVLCLAVLGSGGRDVPGGTGLVGGVVVIAGRVR